ncbi:T9SS type A sorting domain-containing protein, partial [Urechidicola sp. KH5]
FLIGAMDMLSLPPYKPVNHFHGWVDEFRIWNVALSQDQIRSMMNQQIEDNGGKVYGSTIPMEIYGLDWDDLEGYYKMNQAEGDLAIGTLGNEFGFVNGRLRNSETWQEETTPLPYTTKDGGGAQAFSNTGGGGPWKNYDVWSKPGALGIDGVTKIEWNIIEMKHDLKTIDEDVVVSALIMDPGTKLTVVNDTEAHDENNSGVMLWVSRYLKLDGVIDLVGESQLIQKPESNFQYFESWLDPSSAGYIERDQQGILNSTAYNYWSSPVSNINGVTSNEPYYIGEILRDGTTSSTPQSISFGAAYNYADGAITSPIRVSSRWMYRYVNTGNDYANWEYVGNNGTRLNVTEGFTMKGTGSGSLDMDTEYQNYVFRGKPNNAVTSISLRDTPLVHTTFTQDGDISLTGNPFPSALDADQFITDNVNSTDATLYFWEHWSNGTHYLGSYQGGYATRKVGNGVPAVKHPNVAGGGVARSTPGAYVAVGQGFFVRSDSDGGPVEFRNSQRFFERETNNGGTSSVFMRGVTNQSTEQTQDTIQRIRLGFESPDGYHRQVLAAFFEGPTDDIDKLYDGKALDSWSSDAFFVQEDQNFVIQAFGEFRKDREIPIRVIISNAQSGGVQKMMIDELENISNETDIYIKDEFLGVYHDLRESAYEVSLPAGTYDERFSLVFENSSQSLSVDDQILDAYVNVYMFNPESQIRIQNNSDAVIENIRLFNVLGQEVMQWDIEDGYKSEIHLDVRNLETAIYVARVQTDKG